MDIKEQMLKESSDGHVDFQSHVDLLERFQDMRQWVIFSMELCIRRTSRESR